jgi:hypothetical protein
MDEDSDLNLMYLNNFKGLGLGQNLLKTSPHSFYRVVLGKQSTPLGQINLHVTFRDASNYCIETLTFKVVNFSRPYHIILGRPCYVKFMAIPNYTNLNLKISGPSGIITVEGKAQQALDWEQYNIKLATAVVAIPELKE